jgi:hypothetical protein
MRLRPASAQSDQDPCCSLTNPIASRETDSEQHGGAGWSGSMLVANPLYVGFIVTRLILTLKFVKLTVGQVHQISEKCVRLKPSFFLNFNF